eukprot:TRINITY_DN93633_c0_g1_i1.p1 TRINITY_DN93633_c0_g1~~TRINITY_DN93633_c0_g1_i1.p1  ORF type:complete len:193 (-),score=21.97 TRINITY_DN93633_c0_g1_i1:207-785(-)
MKRTTSESQQATRKKQKKVNKTELNKYMRSYHGCDDIHLQVFRKAKEFLEQKTAVQQVLYPGCHRHLTASLVFEDVTYLDCDQKVGTVFSDPAALDWISENKLYDASPSLTFVCGSYTDAKVPKSQFSLAISLSAGFVSPHCMKHVAPGGYLLVNDCHWDARTAFVDPQLELVGWWDSSTSQFSSNWMSFLC